LNLARMGAEVKKRLFVRFAPFATLRERGVVPREVSIVLGDDYGGKVWDTPRKSEGNVRAVAVTTYPAAQAPRRVVIVMERTSCAQHPCAHVGLVSQSAGKHTGPVTYLVACCMGFPLPTCCHRGDNDPVDKRIVRGPGSRSVGSTSGLRLEQASEENVKLIKTYTSDIGRGVAGGDVEACDVASLQPVERARGGRSRGAA